MATSSWFKCEKCGHEVQMLVNPDGPPVYCRKCDGRMIRK